MCSYTVVIAVSEAVAELTVGLVLSVSRKITVATELAKSMDWNQINDAKLLTGKCKFNPINTWAINGSNLSSLKTEYPY